VGERFVVELDVAKDLPLKRFGSVKHQTRPLKCLAQVRETVNVFLIVVNGL